MSDAICTIAVVTLPPGFSKFQVEKSRGCWRPKKKDVAIIGICACANECAPNKRPVVSWIVH